MEIQLINTILSTISLVISVFLLVIHFKNRKIALKGYLINRQVYRSSEADLMFISSSQQEGSVNINLCFYNPSSVAALIKSLTVYKKVESGCKILRFIGVEKWIIIHQAKWWPTENPRCEVPKKLEDEYRKLYVSELVDLKVNIPGVIDRAEYKFQIKTNHNPDGYSHISTINSISSGFPHQYKQWYREK